MKLVDIHSNLSVFTAQHDFKYVQQRTLYTAYYVQHTLYVCIYVFTHYKMQQSTLPVAQFTVWLGSNGTFHQ